MAMRRNPLVQYFAHPEGLMGSIVGDFMATENYQVNMWAIEMLDLQPEDNILEIGFGAGTAIEELCKLPTHGRIAGVDYSELMVVKAKKRNAKAVKSGRVDLRHGSAENLPDFDMTFDKIFAINNIMYWKSPIEALTKLRQNLHSGGSIALVYQRNTHQVNCEDSYITTEMKWYVHCLREAGFCNIQVTSQPIVKGKKDVNKLSLAGLMDKPLSYIYGVHHISGICITAENPTIFDVLEDYFSDSRPYLTSKHLCIQYHCC